MKQTLKKLKDDIPGEIITKEELRDFVIKLRRKHDEIGKKQFFCDKHNFKLEAEAKKNEAEVVREIISHLEHDFDLGFVWDESLDG